MMARNTRPWMTANFQKMRVQEIGEKKSTTDQTQEA